MFILRNVFISYLISIYIHVGLEKEMADLMPFSHHL